MLSVETVSAIYSNPVLWSQFKLGRGRTSLAQDKPWLWNKTVTGSLLSSPVALASWRVLQLERVSSRWDLNDSKSDVIFWKSEENYAEKAEVICFEFQSTTACRDNILNITGDFGSWLAYYRSMMFRLRLIKLLRTGHVGVAPMLHHMGNEQRHADSRWPLNNDQNNSAWQGPQLIHYAWQCVTVLSEENLFRL